MRRVINGLAAAVVVLALAVSPASAATKNEPTPSMPAPIRALVLAIKKLVGRPTDEIVWPKP